MRLEMMDAVWSFVTLLVSKHDRPAGARINSKTVVDQSLCLTGPLSHAAISIQIRLPTYFAIPSSSFSSVPRSVARHRSHDGEFHGEDSTLRSTRQGRFAL